MFVGINIVGIRPGYGGGEEVYLRNVLTTMQDLQRSTRFVLFTDSANHDSFSDYERVQVSPHDSLDTVARDEKVDLLYSSLFRMESPVSVPYVLYAMDLREPTQNSRDRHRLGKATLRTLKSLCGGAAGLVTPSEYVKRQLLELLDVPMDRVVVAPLGVKEAFGEPQECTVEKPYFLVVGRTRKVKNLPMLLEAFGRVSKDIPHNLVIVGQPDEGELEDWGPRVVRVDRLPVKQLAGLYQHSHLFICPSLYEGSGVTVLEAMKAGARVATGRVGGVTEVASDSPLFFNPESADSLVMVLRRAVTESDADRARRIQFGKQLAADFTWEQCAWRTLAGFRKARD